MSVPGGGGAGEVPSTIGFPAAAFGGGAGVAAIALRLRRRFRVPRLLEPEIFVLTWDSRD